jgi:hypothetical protein
MNGKYEFDLRVVDIDREGYYYPRWDRATPMTITAADKQDAVNQACDLMGEAPRGRYWGVKVVAIRSAAEVVR